VIVFQQQQQQPAWTWPVVLTLCIALLALAVSGGALIWQIVSWRRSGPRVRVVRIQGIGVGTLDPTWFIGVQAKNSGRLETEVQQFGFRLPNDKTITSLQNYIGQPVLLPKALPAGGTVSVQYSAQGVREALNRDGHSGKRARPFVDTGHGRFWGKRINLGEELDLLRDDAASG
jgi:hypothetical protein